MLAFAAIGSAALAALTWDVQDSGVTTSIRGMDAVDANVCWFGTKGGVARTVDGGKSWQLFSIGDDADGGMLDFRDVKALDTQRCVAMSAGAGGLSRVYHTVDGGVSWRLAYKNSHPGGFFNGMAFRDDDHGVLAGDPIDGRLFLLKTDDGGKNWRRAAPDTAPEMHDGEHGFAASGTHLAVTGGGRILVSTGGIRARVLLSGDWGASWQSIDTPMISWSTIDGDLLDCGSPGQRPACCGRWWRLQEGSGGKIRT